VKGVARHLREALDGRQEIMRNVEKMLEVRGVGSFPYNALDLKAAAAALQ